MLKAKLNILFLTEINDLKKIDNEQKFWLDKNVTNSCGKESQMENIVQISYLSPILKVTAKRNNNR